MAHTFYVSNSKRIDNIVDSYRKNILEHLFLEIIRPSIRLLEYLMRWDLRVSWMNRMIRNNWRPRQSTENRPRHVTRTGYMETGKILNI